MKMSDRLKELLKFGRSAIFCGFILGICGIIAVFIGAVLFVSAFILK